MATQKVIMTDVSSTNFKIRYDNLDFLSVETSYVELTMCVPDVTVESDNYHAMWCLYSYHVPEDASVILKEALA